MPEEILSGERLPPQAVEVERQVLAAILLDKTALDRVVSLLKPESFYREAHRQIYQAMLDLYEKGEPVVLVTASEALIKAGQLETIGGRAYLASLLEGVATAAHVEHHAKIVLERYVLRKLAQTAT